MDRNRLAQEIGNLCLQLIERNEEIDVLTARVAELKAAAQPVGLRVVPKEEETDG